MDIVRGYRGSPAQPYADGWLLGGLEGVKWGSAYQQAICWDVRAEGDREQQRKECIDHLRYPHKLDRYYHQTEPGCGIYGLWEAKDIQYSNPCLIIAARAWGTVAFHEKGWRASDVELEHIWLNGMYYTVDAAQSFRDRYRIEVETVKTDWNEFMASLPSLAPFDLKIEISS